MAGPAGHHHNQPWFSDSTQTVEDLADLAALGAELTDLASASVCDLSRSDVVDMLVHLTNTHDQLSRLVGSIADTADRLAAPCVVGEKSVPALLRAKSRVRSAQSRHFLTLGRSKYRFPSFARAHRSRQVTAGHVEVITDMAARVDSQQLAAAEPHLCAAASLSTVEEFAQSCREWEAAADPTEHLDAYIRAQAQRRLIFGNDLFGNLHFEGVAGPAEGEAFRNMIEGRTKQLLASDQAAAGDEPLERSHNNRRLDALLELALDGAAASPGTRRPQPVLHLIAMADHEGARSSEIRLYPQTLGGRLIPRAVIDQMLTHGATTKAVKMTPFGDIIDSSVGGRSFPTNSNS